MGANACEVDKLIGIQRRTNRYNEFGRNSTPHCAVLHIADFGAGGCGGLWPIILPNHRGLIRVECSSTARAENRGYGRDGIPARSSLEHEPVSVHLTRGQISRNQ